MTGQRVLIDYSKCDPRRCEGGVCTAALACPRKAMGQEAPYEVPMPPSAPCKGCAECVIHCPLKAVRLVSGS
jgi:translation initiation factor RLI1